MKDKNEYLPHLAAAVMILFLGALFGYHSIFGRLLYFGSIFPAMLGVYRYFKEYIQIVSKSCQQFTKKAKDGFNDKEEQK